jgi:hypothetical protein
MPESGWLDGDPGGSVADPRVPHALSCATIASIAATAPPLPRCARMSPIIGLTTGKRKDRHAPLGSHAASGHGDGARMTAPCSRSDHECWPAWFLVPLRHNPRSRVEMHPHLHLVHPHRPRAACALALRARVWRHQFELDRDLADGARPDQTVEHEERARRLLSSRCRRFLIAELDTASIANTEHPPSWHSVTVPVQSAAVLAARLQLSALPAERPWRGNRVVPAERPTKSCASRLPRSDHRGACHRGHCRTRAGTAHHPATRCQPASPSARSAPRCRSSPVRSAADVGHFDLGRRRRLERACFRVAVGAAGPD